MAPLPVIADTFRVTLNWRGDDGREAHNVMHFLAPTLDADGVLSAVTGHMSAAMWDWVAPTWHIKSLDCTPLDGTTATTTLSGISGSKYDGQGTGQAIIQVAGIVKFLTAERGRSARGRIYIPAVAEGETENGIMDDVAAVQTAWAAFRTALVAADCDLAVASYTHASVLATSTVVAENSCATQRRRLRR